MYHFTTVYFLSRRNSHRKTQNTHEEVEKEKKEEKSPILIAICHQLL